MSFVLPPIIIDVEDAKVEILEVVKYTLPNGEDRYHVVCRLYWRDIKTRPFFLDAKDMDDLRKKIEIELSKIKILYIIGGRNIVEEVVSR